MRKSLFSILILTALASSAQASLYDFSQTGFSEGATISGSFQANDLNGNGLIQGSVFSDFSEISAFSLSFSGNSDVPAFSQSFSDLSFLGYSLGQNQLGAANPEGLATNWFGDSGYTYVSGVYANGAQGGGIIDWSTGFSTETSQLLSISAAPVPESASLTLLLTGLAGLTARLKRKTA